MVLWIYGFFGFNGFFGFYGSMDVLMNGSMDGWIYEFMASKDHRFYGYYGSMDLRMDGSMDPLAVVTDWYLCTWKR
jgi:hypothetical protein